MSKLLYTLFFLILLSACTSKDENHSTNKKIADNKEVKYSIDTNIINAFLGRWHFNWLWNEIKVDEDYVYEFRKNRRFSFYSPSYPNYSSAFSGRWTLKKHTDTSMTLNIVFDKEVPSNEFGTTVFTIPDTTKISPSGQSYNYFHFSSAIVNVINENKFTLTLDKTLTPYKENPLVFNNFIRIIEPIIAEYHINKEKKKGHDYIFKNHRFYCDCIMIDSDYIDKTTNDYCNHFLNRVFVYFPESQRIFNRDINNDGIKDFVFNYTIEGLGGGNGYFNYDRCILGGDILKYIDSDNVPDLPGYDWN